MTPQTQQRPTKGNRVNGKGKLALAPANEKTKTVDWAAFLAGMSYGKTVLEYGADAQSSCRETLRIPCGISIKAR